MAEPTYTKITLTTTDGCSIEVYSDTAGVASGYGFIANPYFIPDGELGADEHHRFKDGETVIGCPADHPRAMPIADAYQELRNRWEFERAEWDQDYKLQLIQPEPTPLTHNPFASLARIEG